MPTFRFNKLVRDNFRQIYDDLGQVVKTRELTNLEFKKAIRDKIIEEARELPVREHGDDEIASEIGDIQQAIDDLREVYDISAERVADAQAKKFVKKGGFTTGLYIETIELQDNDPWVEYYRNEPDKYPEIKNQ